MTIDLGLEVLWERDRILRWLLVMVKLRIDLSMFEKINN
jgi:hypothetical protein